MLRVKCIASIAIGLLAGIGALASPAQASPIPVPVLASLEITYFATIPGEPGVPVPPPTIYFGTQLSGSASFYNSADGLFPSPPPIDIGHLDVGGAFFASFEPPDPCIGAASCQEFFSFGGLAGPFGAAAFRFISDLPSPFPSPPPIMPLGFF